MRHRMIHNVHVLDRARLGKGGHEEGGVSGGGYDAGGGALDSQYLSGERGRGEGERCEAGGRNGSHKYRKGTLCEKVLDRSTTAMPFSEHNIKEKGVHRTDNNSPLYPEFCRALMLIRMIRCAAKILHT